MKSKANDVKSTPEFLTTHGFQVLRALVEFGGNASQQRVADYLGWTSAEVSDEVARLKTWELVRLSSTPNETHERLQLTQYGEMAVLEKCGLDISGYVELVTSYYEEWRDYYRSL